MTEKKMQLVDCKSAQRPPRRERVSFSARRLLRDIILATFWSHRLLNTVILICMLTTNLLRAG